MEVYNIQRRQQNRHFPCATKTSLNIQLKSSNGKRHKTFKSQTMFGGVSKSRLRRMNSIEENIISLFKENQSKIELYFNGTQPVPDVISTLNIQNPQIFSLLSEGVYVLVQGTVKMITFDEQKQIYKNNIKQIINSVFRKLRINKELGLRARDGGSQYVKKCLISEKSDEFYTIATFQEPFSVLESVNQNCMSFSNDTILYKIDQDQKKIFKYYQNKQKVKDLLYENKLFFKAHSMLYHTFNLKKFAFRNQFKVENVALIKKGTVKAFRNGHKKTFINDLQNNKKTLCELGQSSLLVQGFSYEISSHEADIIFIQPNETFQFLKNPDWVIHFDETQNFQKKDVKQCNLKKKTINSGIKRHFKKYTMKGSSLSGYISPHYSGQINFSPKNHELNEQKSLQIKDVYPEINENNFSNNLISNSQFLNGSCLIKEALSIKSKKIEFLKMLSPYILISQKVGLKQIMKTRAILNERSLNVSPLRLGKQEKINKLSKTRLQISKRFPKTELNSKQNSVKHESKTLLKFQKYLKEKNHNEYKEQRLQKQKKQANHHRKSFSELTPITSSNFHLSLKKNLTKTTNLNFKNKWNFSLQRKLQIPHGNDQKLNPLLTFK